MQKEAAKGFRFTESYKRSDEARTVEEDLRVAHSRRVWESVGLEPLARIDHRPLALTDAFDTDFPFASRRTRRNSCGVGTGLKRQPSLVLSRS